jgi:hypothetical protein
MQVTPIEASSLVGTHLDGIHPLQMVAAVLEPTAIPGYIAG